MARWKNPIPNVSPVSQEVLRIIFASISDWFNKPSNFLAYGAFQDTTDQTIASTTTAYPITFNTTDFSNGVSIVSNSRVTFVTSGIYNLQWSGQFQNTDTQDHDAEVWIRKNGVDVPGSTGVISVPSSHGGTPGHSIVGWNYFVEASEGDYFQLYWQADSTLISLQFYAAGTSPTRPSTASVILTASQVG